MWRAQPEKSYYTDESKLGTPMMYHIFMSCFPFMVIVLGTVLATMLATGAVVALCEIAIDRMFKGNPEREPT